MSIEENKALVKKWNEEVWNKGNLAFVDENFTPNFTFNYAFPGMSSDREGYKQTVSAYRSVFGNMKLDIDDMIAVEDKVVTRWSGSSIHRGDFVGIAPTGKEVSTTGISIIRIVGGKIAQEWTEMDMLGTAMQLGAFS